MPQPSPAVPGRPKRSRNVGNFRVDRNRSAVKEQLEEEAKQIVDSPSLEAALAASDAALAKGQAKLTIFEGNVKKWL